MLSFSIASVPHPANHSQPEHISGVQNSAPTVVSCLGSHFLPYIGASDPAKLDVKLGMYGTVCGLPWPVSAGEKSRSMGRFSSVRPFYDFFVPGFKELANDSFLCGTVSFDGRFEKTSGFHKQSISLKHLSHHTY